MQHGIYKILTPEKAQEVRTLLDTQEWQQGKARTEKLTGSVKQNFELKPGEHGALVTELSKQVTQAIAQSHELMHDTLFKQMMSCKFNKYCEPAQGAPEPGGAYHRHTDAPFMGKVRTDFTAVLALTPKDDYEGGDHHVVDPHQGEMIFRPDVGELMIYETGYPHWVDPVTKGSRVSALTWIESTVMGVKERALLKCLRELSRDMEERIDYEADECDFREWFVDVGVIHSGLHRMWAER